MLDENQSQEGPQNGSGKPAWERWVSSFLSGVAGAVLAFCFAFALNLRSPVFFGALIVSGLVIGSLLGYRFTWFADFLLVILHGF
jgi:hypothetical protein